MLEGYNLVYFSPGQWDGLWRNRHQLMSIFGQKNRVLWVERRPHRRAHRGQTSSGGQLTGRSVSGLLGTLRHIAGNLHVYSYPAWAPVSGRPLIKQFTQSVRQMAIRKAMQVVHGPPDPRSAGSTSSGPCAPAVVWFSHPGMVDLFGELPPQMQRSANTARRTNAVRPRCSAIWLYHVVDEYTAYSGVTSERRQILEAREREMMAQVDAVIVVSKPLYEAKRPYNEHTYLVPNGVNFAAYSEALADAHHAQELDGIPAPRLGYSGLIGDRLDMRMLMELAREHPEWSLVFLGEARVAQQTSEWEAMLRLPNVHYVGQVDVSRVPYFLKGFQVGLMPYNTGLESENISPLKLYDYLAAGLPVASVDIPAAREFSQQVHLASRPDEFAHAVAAALVDTTPERKQQRREIAAQHTWEARVEQLSQIIRHLETQRGDRHPW